MVAVYRIVGGKSDGGCEELSSCVLEGVTVMERYPHAHLQAWETPRASPNPYSVLGRPVEPQESVASMAM